MNELNSENSNDSSANSIQRINDLFKGKAVYPVPKGELWLGTELLKRAGLTDTVHHHLQLAKQLGHDIVCLPVAPEGETIPNLGYVYFDHTDLKDLVADGDVFTAAVIDGPFQTLVNRMGLIEALTGLMGDQDNFFSQYRKTAEGIFELAKKCLGYGVHCLVTTDDMAADKAPLANPASLDELCTPFYTRLSSTVHEAGAKLLMHCCGGLSMLCPLFSKWDVDGLASIQLSLNNFEELLQKLGGSAVIMAGIDACLLDRDEIPTEHLKTLEEMINKLAPTGSLILSSSAGLYSGDFLKRIKTIYKTVDALFHQPDSIA